MDLEKIRAAFWHDGEIGEDCAAELIKEVDILRAEIAQLSIQVVDRGESFERVTADLAAEQSLRAAAEGEVNRLTIENAKWYREGNEFKEAWRECLAAKNAAEGEVERLTAIIRELLIAMPGRDATCDDMHHAKKDQHGCDEECKPLARFEGAVKAAAMVLSKTAQKTKEPK